MNAERFKKQISAAVVTGALLSPSLSPTAANAERIDNGSELSQLRRDQKEHVLYMASPEKPKDKPEDQKKPQLLLGKPNRLGYYQLPPSRDGSYIFIDPKCTQEHWGNKEVVKKIYNVAQKWKEKYPQGHLRIGDLNGPAWEHASHKWGYDFDLNATTNGKDWVANMKRGNYNQKATSELAKLFADEGKIKFIFFNDPKVRSEVDRHKGWDEGEKTQYAKNHADHFHIRYDMPRLPSWAPEGNDKDCGVEPGEKH